MTTPASNCPTCGASVSADASHCPHCRSPLPASGGGPASSVGLWFIILLVIAGVAATALKVAGVLGD